MTDIIEELRNYSGTRSTETEHTKNLWKYIKKLSQEGHPSDKDVDLSTDDYYFEFLEQEGVPPVQARCLGPVSFLSTAPFATPAPSSGNEKNQK